MKIVDNELRNMFITILKGLIDKSDIDKEECVIALSEDKSKIVIYAKSEKYIDDNLPSWSTISILEYLDGKYVLLVTIPIFYNITINGIDITNSADKLAIGFITDKEYVKIYSFNKKGRSEQTISNNSENILFGYNVLFNNDNKLLLISAPIGHNQHGSYFIYSMSDRSGYVEVDYNNGDFRKAASIKPWFYGSHISELEYISKFINMHYSFHTNKDGIVRMYHSNNIPDDL